MTMKWNHGGLCAVLAIRSVLAAWLLGDVPFFHILNLEACDAHTVVRDLLTSRPAIPNIVLLSADQKALDP